MQPPHQHENNTLLTTTLCHEYTYSATASSNGSRARGGGTCPSIFGPEHLSYVTLSALQVDLTPQLFGDELLLKSQLCVATIKA